MQNTGINIDEAISSSDEVVVPTVDNTVEEEVPVIPNDEKKIENFELTYDEMYQKCYNQIENYSKSSVQSHLLGGIAKASKATGNLVAKIPYINKSQIDEGLIEQGEKLSDLGNKRTERTMEYISVFENSSATIFIENINVVNMLYNKPLDLLVDKENIYLGCGV